MLTSSGCRNPRNANSSHTGASTVPKIVTTTSDASGPFIISEIGPLGAAHGDPVMVRQIFANLIGNACKYSSSRAAPTVKIGVIDGAVRRYCVRDNGIGFDMAYAQNLFGMFRRLHSDATIPGNGVGLAIVKKLVEQHNGMIAADAVPGEGASFTFSLGAAQAN